MLRRAAWLVVLAGVGGGAAVCGCSRKSDSPAVRGAVRPALDQYNLNRLLVALHDYSPVSYFDPGKAQKGTTPYVVSHRGIHYKFTGPMQVETFKADPDKYEPACGGWCAYNMTAGKKVDVDPTSFKIVDGRLLLFAPGALRLWEGRDQGEMMRKAEEAWAAMIGK